MPLPRGCWPTSGTNATTLREHVLHVAERAEAELGEERPCFIDGCPAEWQELPIPEGRIVVGLDGGYVRNWEDRKSNFAVIVGRSLPTLSGSQGTVQTLGVGAGGRSLKNPGRPGLPPLAWSPAGPRNVPTPNVWTLPDLIL